MMAHFKCYMEPLPFPHRLKTHKTLIYDGDISLSYLLLISQMCRMFVYMTEPRRMISNNHGGISTSLRVDSDEPVQSPSKLGNTKWCTVSSLTHIEYSTDMQRL